MLYFKKLIPEFIKNRIRFTRDFLKAFGKNREILFTEIYDKQIWGTPASGEKFYSGSGTSDSSIEAYKKVLIELIKEKDIKKVFEIGCGDFSIMKSVKNKVEIDYTGSDIVGSLIEYLSLNSADQNTRFIHLDAVSEPDLPTADLCIIRQVLQHLSNTEIAAILTKTKKYRYVLITEHVPLIPQKKNRNKITGHRIRLDQKQVSGVFPEESPFSLKCNKILSYRADYGGIPAVMVTNLIENTNN